MNLKIIKNNYFKVLRGGSHTTFQDSGFTNNQHLGITTGGVVDYELYNLSNKILNNTLNYPVIEFCFQGPCLKLMNGKSRIVITGNVVFNIIKSKKTFNGIPNQSYLLKKGDIIDIISTIKSNYGYLSIEGGFKLKKKFGSYSTLTTAKIGSNNGEKIQDNQNLLINKEGKNTISKINLNNRELTKYIRVVSGPQMNFFFPKVLKKFFEKPFKISKDINRMGIRLEENICKSVKSHNIHSEAITKGSVQVPGDGNPIILMNDHPTIGGYPKIATVILTDLPKVAQLPIGSQFNFKHISLREAEILYKRNIHNLNNQLKNIKKN